MVGPLDDIRVLDFTRVVSGPSCTKALADLGADVIKIEPPAGDMTRTATPRVDGMPVYFAQQNTGKRCISIDLTTEKGKNLARRLADSSDVVVENFRPGVMARLGLAEEALRSTNPSLIYCAITGYGQDGPGTDRRAYAPMIHAEVGLLDLTAKRRGAEVANEVASWADLQSGVQAALAVVAALRHRDRTGEGQFIDVAMADVMLQMTEWTAVELAGGDEDGAAVFGPAKAPVVTVADGTRASIPGDPLASWKGWMWVIGDDELAADPRFATQESRVAHRAEAVAAIRRWALTIPNFEELEARVGIAGKAAGRVRSYADVRDAEWAKHREALVDVGTDSELLLPRAPVRFSGLESGTRGRPAHQGAHNREVCSELGLSVEEIDQLLADDVLIEQGVDAVVPTPPPEK